MTSATLMTATNSLQNSPGHVRDILDITDDADIIANVFQDELVISYKSVVEATDIVCLDKNFAN